MNPDADAHSTMVQKHQLVVIDDDDLVIASLRPLLPSNWTLVPGLGADPATLASRASAVLVDMHLSGNTEQAEGLDIVKAIASANPWLEVIAMSGNLDRSLMEHGLKAGASRFLPKPLGRDEIRLTLEKIEALVELRSRTVSVNSPTGVTRAQWIGKSVAAIEVLKKVAQLRGEKGPILLIGESGTGKEVVAELIHQQEGPSRPLISLNLGAIPETVFESELFGHVKGAFTGADQNKQGLAEAAHGGDLFLDEIEALPLVNQAKLLRFLETGEVRKVGGREAIKVNVRVIAASNRDLGEMVANKEFRDDLLWRLQGKVLRLPPLRERKDDVEALASHFLNSDRPGRKKTLGDDAILALKNHDWPGNVRELKRICEQLSLYSPLPIIRALDVETAMPAQRSSQSSLDIDSLALNLGLHELVSRFEAKIIRKALEEVDDIDAVAERLGVSRSNLYKKMKDYGIERL